MFGRMVGDQRQGWAIFAAMARPVPRRRRDRLLGRSGRQSRLRRARHRSRRRARCRPAATWKARRSASASPTRRCSRPITTDASCGAVNSMHDSFTPLGGAGAAVQHPARRDHLRRRRRRPLRHAAVRHHRGVHRRADGRPHAGISRQEDRGQGGQDGDARHPDPAAVDPRLHRARHGARRRRSPASPTQGPHGFSEILYAYTSGTGNNGWPSPASAPTRSSTTRRSASRC